MFLAWIWEMFGGECKYDFNSVFKRFIFFDLWCWFFASYGFFLFFTGQLD